MPFVLITFTGYGQHLHGRADGSWERKLGCREPSTPLERYEFGLLTEPPFELDAKARTVVLAAIKETTAIHDWQLLAAHIRSTHAHAVLHASEPRRALTTLKAYATRALRAGGLSRGKVWTRGGSIRVLSRSSSVAQAVQYVLDCQGEPMARYP